MSIFAKIAIVFVTFLMDAFDIVYVLSVTDWDDPWRADILCAVIVGITTLTVCIIYNLFV